jgi:hypothetical protein
MQRTKPRRENVNHHQKQDGFGLAVCGMASGDLKLSDDQPGMT